MIRLIKILVIFKVIIFSPYLLTSQELAEDSISIQKLYSGEIDATVDSKNLLDEEIKNLNILDNSNISLSVFIINLFLTAIFSIILSIIYINYGNSLSNRKQFSRNFLTLSLTTMLIISVVKSSLALSLGLVGALSIIRFRSAIKEPEELVYLFIAISIGLGFGANQTLITITALVIIMFLIVGMSKLSSNYYDNSNLFLIISTKNIKKLSSDKIIKVVTQFCKSVNLRRIDDNSEILEVSISVELNNYKDIFKIKNQLTSIDKSLKFTYLDNKGIIG